MKLIRRIARIDVSLNPTFFRIRRLFELRLIFFESLLVQLIKQKKERKKERRKKENRRV
jgi:hypothetical protein